MRENTEMSVSYQMSKVKLQIITEKNKANGLHHKNLSWWETRKWKLNYNVLIIFY